MAENHLGFLVFYVMFTVIALFLLSTGSFAEYISMPDNINTANQFPAIPNITIDNWTSGNCEYLIVNLTNCTLICPIGTWTFWDSCNYTNCTCETWYYNQQNLMAKEQASKIDYTATMFNNIGLLFILMFTNPFSGFAWFGYFWLGLTIIFAFIILTDVLLPLKPDWL